MTETASGMALRVFSRVRGTPVKLNVFGYCHIWHITVDEVLRPKVDSGVFTPT